MSEEITKVLDALAERFGAQGAELWNALVLYERVQGVSALVVVAVLTALVVRRTGGAIHNLNEVESLSAFLVDCLLFALWVTTLVFAPMALGQAFVPEAAVIRGFF